MRYSLDHAREGTHPEDAAPIRCGKSTRPLELPSELLDMLASRLEFIEEKLLPELAGTDAAPSPSRL